VHAVVPVARLAACSEGRLTFSITINVFAIFQRCQDTEFPAEFIRNSWTVDYDECIGDIVKRFSGMPYEFMKARVYFVKQAQSAA
jgi:hypothetical protein